MNKEKFIEIVKPYTQTSEERIIALYNSLEYIRNQNIEGDIVECGVWKGGNILGILHYLDFHKMYNIKVWLYDTFSGQTEPDDNDFNHFNESAKEMMISNKFDYNIAPIDEVKKILSESKFPIENINYIIGDVEETLNYNENLPNKISILRLDTDFYKSTKKELEILYPILCDYGILIIDDYGYWKGSKLAVDNYFESINYNPEVNFLMENNLTFQGILIIKNKKKEIENILSETLNYIGKNKKNIFTVQIGAMDGIISDETRFYLNKYNWKSLLVEPIPYWFEKLKENLKDKKNYIFEQCAITENDGEIEMVTVPYETIIKENLSPDFRGMSTVYPIKEKFSSFFDKKFTSKIKVPSLSLNSLFEKNNVNKIDIFICDAECYDWEIFKQFDFSKYDPYFIRLEYFNLTDDEKFLLKNKLESNDYIVEIGQDIDAVKKSLWEEIIKNKPDKRNMYGYSRVYNIKPIMEYKQNDHYFNLLKWLIKLTNCQSYLELGIEYGFNILEMKNIVKKCVGVDINKNINTDGFEFYQMTTDNFFMINDKTFDIIFIDANHNFEQVKKDFNNSLKILNKYGIIIIHDTDPIVKELLSSNHCHDSYKIIDYINENEELNIITLPLQETGMTFVMRKNDKRINEFLKN